MESCCKVTRNESSGGFFWSLKSSKEIVEVNNAQYSIFVQLYLYQICKLLKDGFGEAEKEFINKFIEMKVEFKLFGFFNVKLLDYRHKHTK